MFGDCIMMDWNLFFECVFLFNSDLVVICEFYVEWVKIYDMDLLLVIGYVVFKVVVDVLVKYIEVNVFVLDVGCGIGFVGLELFKLDVSLIIDGIDLILEMLVMLCKSGVYCKLNEVDMCGLFYDIVDNEYDVVVSVGVFIDGYVGLDGIDELIWIIKLGEIVVIIICDIIWEIGGFKDKIDMLSVDGCVKMLEFIFSFYYIKEDIFC